MKRWPAIMLAIALILTIFDGVATYFELSHKLVTEGNFIPTLVQSEHGLENWLLFHVAMGIFFALAAVYMFWRQRYGVIIAWFAIEVFLCLNHLWIFVLWISIL